MKETCLDIPTFRVKTDLVRECNKKPDNLGGTQGKDKRSGLMLVRDVESTACRGL